MKAKGEEPICYVYTLIHIESGKVFYVGRGTLQNGQEVRYREHLSSAKCGSPYYVHRKIRFLLNSGQTIKFEVCCTGCSYTESCEIEKQLIKSYGRDNLCNLTEGGDSVTHMYKKVYIQDALTKKLFNFESVKEASAFVGIKPGALSYAARYNKKPSNGYYISYTSFI